MRRQRSRQRTQRLLAPGALVAALALSALLAACAGELNTPVEALRLLATALPDAVVGEPYSAQLPVTGGLRPYSFSLESGRLPTGLSLANGTLSGTPAQVGEASFEVRVADANLSQFTAEYRIRVVEVPPTALSLRPPETEVRSAVTLRARVSEARSLLGLRTLITWDPEAFSLRPDSVVTSRRGVALFHSASPGSLQIDLALLAGQGPAGASSLDGAADLFSFVLEPLAAPAQVAVAATTEFVSASGQEGHRRELATLVEGGPAARASLAAAAPAAPASDVPEDPEADEPTDDEGEPDEGEPDEGEDVGEGEPDGPAAGDDGP